MGTDPGAGDGVPADFVGVSGAGAGGDGERWFRQEYGCEFTEAADGVFDREMLERAITTEYSELKLGW
jgi:hypothetical protein